MPISWQSWRSHVDYVVATQGRWIGIGDGNGYPLVTLDVPNILEAPEQWMDSPDLSITIPATEQDSSRPNWVVRTFVLDELDNINESGQLEAAQADYTLLMAFPGKDGVQRRGGVITHVDAVDRNNSGIPEEVTIHALNFNDVWHTIPAVSWPVSWWDTRPYPRNTDESGKQYEKYWDMARVELATHLTFTWKNGPAGFVIRRLAQESLDVVMSTQKNADGTFWVDDPYHVVEVPESDTTPVISVDARDGTLWETVSAQAKNAGVLLGTRLWWPGDPPVRCWSLVNSSMSASQVDISPSQGESSREVEEVSFPHAMVVLTVKEVG